MATTSYVPSSLALTLMLLIAALATSLQYDTPLTSLCVCASRPSELERWYSGEVKRNFHLTSFVYVDFNLSAFRDTYSRHGVDMALDLGSSPALGRRILDSSDSHDTR